MRRVFGAIGIVILIACGVFYSWSERIGRGQLPGSNSVRMRVSAGSVLVVGSRSPEYLVTVDGPSPEMAKTANVYIDREHRPVLINISEVPQGYHVRVQIPEQSNLAVRMGAGELQIQHVYGDKYAMLRAGKMVIDVGQNSEYSSANASVLAGALHLPAFSTEKGGLFRSFAYHGSGSHALVAHVTSGDMVLQQTATNQE